jgi:uncharacterized YigZ family protein
VPAAPVRVETHRAQPLHRHAARAESVADAKAVLASVRSEFPDATHHCFAYAIGPPGSTDAVASADDGEPAGTAGRPMLGVLLNSGLGDVVVVVSRYFGGVKLGKGGLVRAYRGSVQHALREVTMRERVDVVELVMVVPYAAVDAAPRGGTRRRHRRGGDYAEEVALTLRAQKTGS